MTVVAYKDGVMSADSGCFDGDEMIGRMKKILVLKFKGERALYGAAGDCHSRLFDAMLRRCLKKGLLPTEEDMIDCDVDLEGLLVLPDGSVYHLTVDTEEESCSCFQIDADYAAIGSGRACALGALHSGASPEEAVAAAIEHHLYTRGPIQTERLVDN